MRPSSVVEDLEVPHLLPSVKPPASTPTGRLPSRPVPHFTRGIPLLPAINPPCLRGTPSPESIRTKRSGTFERALDAAARKAGLKLPAPARKASLSALSERDETAAICRDQDGNPEPDPELRDTESVPLPPGDDPADAEGVPASVRAFFDREVKPHVSDAWIDTGKRDPKDGRVGLIGYEINFNRYFYRYTPPRPIEEIEADIRAIEGDIVRMLAEVTGAGRSL